MGMPVRTYNHFESGAGSLNEDYVHRFAAAVDADGHAILMAITLRVPELAIHCMDNKLIRILLMAVQDFYASAGRDIARLQAPKLIATFGSTFAALTASAREHDAYVEQWMNDRTLGGAPPPEDEA